MLKYFSLLILISGVPCLAQKAVIQDNVAIDVYTYTYENKKKAAAMPQLKAKSKLNKYKRRFEYLIVNVPEIHTPGKTEERNAIFNLYPHKSQIKKRYLEELAGDKKFTGYFEETVVPINNPNTGINHTYSIDELMEVASKFFYCDKVTPDSNIQSHVCIIINGLKETQWEKDYTLLTAFCFEAIFSDLDKNTSAISESYGSEKKKSRDTFKKNITTLDKYLEDVKLDLFSRMKNNAVLKKELLAYYELNKSNLAFRIEN
jgi:hypothetical protein